MRIVLGFLKGAMFSIAIEAALIYLAFDIFSEFNIGEFILLFFIVQGLKIVLAILSFTRSWVAYYLFGKRKLIQVFRTVLKETNAPHLPYVDGIEDVIAEINSDFEEQEFIHWPTVRCRQELFAIAGQMEAAKLSGPLTTFIMLNSTFIQAYEEHNLSLK
ncbi:MAG: hypothetical protein JJ858_11010 [Rhizobiaceae bacterium]|nr:hypothetical protein [Rhizobiaceae bacterium]